MQWIWNYNQWDPKLHEDHPQEDSERSAGLGGLLLRGFAQKTWWVHAEFSCHSLSFSENQRTRLDTRKILAQDPPRLGRTCGRTTSSAFAHQLDRRPVRPRGPSRTRRHERRRGRWKDGAMRFPEAKDDTGCSDTWGSPNICQHLQKFGVPSL